MGNFPETTSQEGEQPYDDESRLTKGQQRRLKSMRMAKKQPYPKKQQCDVEGFAEEETKEAPALHLQPQSVKAEEDFESAEPAAAFLCGFESEGDAQTEEYIDFRRDDSDCLHTTQMRTLTKDSEELEAEQSADELASVVVKEQSCPEIKDEVEVEEAEVFEETENEEVEAPKTEEDEKEEKEVSGWAIPSATRIGGAVRSSHLRFAPEKPR